MRYLVLKRTTKSQYDMLKEIKVVLKQWSSDWLDNKLISKLSYNPSNGEVLYASAAGTQSSITANDKLTTTIISVLNARR